MARTKRCTRNVCFKRTNPFAEKQFYLKKRFNKKEKTDNVKERKGWYGDICFQ